MSKREYIHKLIYSMKVGQELVLERRFVAEAFPCGWLSMYRNTREALLSTLIGSGCGAFRVAESPRNGDLIVSRHEESGKRYYIDPDRAHMFNPNPDGTLSLKPEYDINHQTEGEERPVDAGRKQVARGE